jgi:hypothetical protein
MYHKCSLELLATLRQIWVHIYNDVWWMTNIGDHNNNHNKNNNELPLSTKLRESRLKPYKSQNCNIYTKRNNLMYSTISMHELNHHNSKTIFLESLLFLLFQKQTSLSQ